MAVPLGTIARELERALPEGVVGHPTSEQADLIGSVYERFDWRYKNRNDYKLWRCMFEPYFTDNKPGLAGWQTGLSGKWIDWAHFARLGADSRNLTEFWSTLAIAPEIIQKCVWAGELDDAAPIWMLVNRLYGRLSFEMEVLPACPASCGIATGIFLMRYQYLHDRAGKRFSSSAISDLLEHLERWLRVVDPAWEPGRKVDTSTSEEERKRRKGRLRPYHDIQEFDTLVGALRAVCAFISENTVELNAHTTELHKLGAKYAYSAWLSARSRRIQEAEFQAAICHKPWFNENAARAKRRETVLTEFHCLKNLALATRDAARREQDYLDFSKYGYLLLRLIPDEFAYDHDILKEIKGARSINFRYIKEAGLEVDWRYDSDNPSSPLYSPIENRRIRDHPSTGLQPSDYFDWDKDAEESGTGHFLVVARDQRIMPEWQHVKNEIPRARWETPHGYLLTAVSILGITVKRRRHKSCMTVLFWHVIMDSFEVPEKYSIVLFIKTISHLRRIWCCTSCIV